MKKMLSVLAISLLATTAYAQDTEELDTADLATTLTSSKSDKGVINFDGKVLPSTCRVETNSQNLNVELKSVTVNDFLDEPNVVHGKTPFTVNLVQCSGPITGVSGTADHVTLTFDADSRTVEGGALKNTAAGGDAATNVSLQISSLKGDQETALDLSVLGYDNDIKQQLDGSSLKHFHFNVGYKAVGGTPTQGKVTAQLPFQIEYR